MTESLLEIRKELKERKPDFIRQDYQRRKKLGRKLKWRKPKGIHSKIRHHFKGRRKMPSPGYKSPRKAKGLHSSGLRMVPVHSIEDIKKIKNGSEGAVISKNVGIKKKLGILKMAKEIEVKVLNLNIDEQIKKIESFANSKKKKDADKAKKDVVKEVEEKSKEPKAGLDATVNEEKRKESEKKEKDKILTKKV